MFYKDSNNNKYYLGRAFNHGDIQYGAGAATHAKFTELGFTRVVVGSRPDGRFYFVSGPDINGAYATTARDLNDLKLNFIMAEKRLARDLLKNSDWLVVRNQETNDVIPAAYLTYRAAIRTTNNTRCNEINACTTVDELKDLIDAPESIEDPSNPGQYIQNTAALTAYPTEVDEEASVTADYGL